MKIAPVATYRLQFRQGMTFDAAVEVVPYLRRLGISHLYTSPIFTAVPGSTHGYDVVDHNEIDPALGGRAGFDRLHTALAQAGMGLVLDIVPNHMAASLQNPWWRSVVEFGAKSPYAHHFDIDWRERLTLPILGKPFDAVLAAGELALEADTANGCLCIAYFNNRVPLTPESYGALADRLRIPELAELATCDDANVFHGRVQALFAGDVAVHMHQHLALSSRDLQFLRHVHDMQPWQLTFWKDARRHLTYRRFFEVTGLAGVRVEDEKVFRDVHRLVLDLVREGKVEGLRIDHVDGLAEPGSYLRSLRAAVGADCWLLVEKIRGREEPLPPDWPDAGTTGYEFIPAMADLLVDREGLEMLRIEHDRFVGCTADVTAEERQAKLLMLRRNFEGELARLAGLASLDDADISSPDDLETAIAEIIAGFEVYRTYGEQGGLSQDDRERLAKAATLARARGAAKREAIERVVSLLERPDRVRGADGFRFRTRFQQLTGPVMAKAVEDTLFYRHNAFIALNEVGATPGAIAGEVRRFHEAMEQFRGEPVGLAATATHDTKRGEDARARLYALSEAPERWSEAVRLWGEQSGVPEPAVRWMIGQMVCGAWPTDGQRDEAAGAALAPRLAEAVKKALREAKLRTDWLDPDETYEKRVLTFLGSMFDPGSEHILRDFIAILTPIIRAGDLNSLAQTMAKLTGPGVPDFYQGAERTDLSLVDPDNRRPVDFATYAAALRRAEETGPDRLAFSDGSFKQWMIATVLRCRAQHLALFRSGSHVPLRVEGLAAAHCVAWLRQYSAETALVVVPRHTLRRQAQHLTGAEAEILLPRGRTMLRNVLSGQRFAADTRISVAAIMGGLPVALCVTEPTS